MQTFAKNLIDNGKTNLLFSLLFHSLWIQKKLIISIVQAFGLLYNLKKAWEKNNKKFV
jgi:hypothetical protein